MRLNPAIRFQAPDLSDAAVLPELVVDWPVDYRRVVTTATYADSALNRHANTLLHTFTLPCLSMPASCHVSFSQLHFSPSE